MVLFHLLNHGTDKPKFYTPGLCLDDESLSTGPFYLLAAFLFASLNQAKGVHVMFVCLKKKKQPLYCLCPFLSSHYVCLLFSVPLPASLVTCSLLLSLSFLPSLP